MKEMIFRVDPVLVSIVEHKLESIAREMGITMERTSRSPIFFLAHDFSTCIFNAEGLLVAQVEYIPVHVAGGSFAARAVIEYFGEDIYPGDIVLVNDPYTLNAGNHLMDWTILAPVFYGEELLFWACNRAHQIDPGGSVPGGYIPDATDIHQEGLKISPVKIYERGKLRRDMFDLILNNVRFKEGQRGDLMSMIGSVRIGEKRLMELIEIIGTENIRLSVDDLIKYTETLMRAEIDKVPDGLYQAETSFDGDPFGGPYTIRAKVIVEGDTLVVDLSESDKQVKGYVNSSLSNTYSCVYIALMTSLGQDLPRNEGVLKPVRIIAPAGTIVNAQYPAPCGLCTLHCGQEIIEAIWKALAQAIPEKVSAGWSRLTSVGATVGWDPRTNEPFTCFNFNAMGGAGAIWGFDGWHALGTPIGSGGTVHYDVETLELVYPHFVLEYELHKDSAGVGRWRGGCGMVYKIRNYGYNTILSSMAEGMKTSTFGIMGGKPSDKVPQIKILQKGMEITVDDKKVIELEEDSILICLNQGGAGVGNPRERELEKIREDVKNEIVSLEMTKEAYGVIIDHQ